MNITGEYWIHPDGQITYADGDMGDFNHDMVVVDSVRRTIVDTFAGKVGPYGKMKRNYTDYDYVDWDEFVNDLERYFGNGLNAIKNIGISDDDWAVANETIDVQEYATKSWGWKAVRGHHLDTWTLTKKDIKAIIDGIENILDSESISDDVEDAGVDLYISVYSTKQYFDTTLKELKDRIRPQSITPAQQQLQQTNRNKEQYYKWMSNNAYKQVKDMDYQNIHPSYKRAGVSAFGDSVVGFKVWLYEQMDRKS